MILRGAGSRPASVRETFDDADREPAPQGSPRFKMSGVFVEPNVVEPGNRYRSCKAPSELIVNNPESDQELLERMRGGCEEAFTSLYRRRQAAVYRFALQMTGNTVMAEDVTQEVFMALLEHGGRYDAARGSLASFLFGIARNLVLRRLEKDRSAGAEMVAEELAACEDLFEDLTRRETIDQVRRAVLSLPPVYREAVVLCDLQDISYEDASAALDCPIGTVRSRLNRGRSMLAQKLRGNTARVAGRAV